MSPSHRGSFGTAARYLALEVFALFDCEELLSD